MEQLAGPSSRSDCVTCENCFISYWDFCVHYSGKVDLIIAFAQRHGLILAEKKCPNCENVCRIDYKKLAFRCDRSVVTRGKRKRRCNFFVSCFKGTWFGKAKLDIETNLKFVFLFLQKAFSFEFVSFELKLNNHTIVDWCSFCREVLISWGLRRSRKIGGPGLTVEIDESKFGKRKYNVGCVIEGQWVFGGICRETRDLFFVPVQDRSAETLLAIIRQYIAEGTTVISDCWKAYNCLEKEGYKHLTVNHSVNFVDPVTGAHTNTIERTWRGTKVLVPKYGRRKDHFVGYLAVAYFKLAITDPAKRLHHFLLAAADLYPPTP
ncbi:uncharacterized protein [Palaemon carinicauda]|uniref:uncharacterized protein isoform X1 n=1 Tax=Palaemon carinicauda TaxID=392227 RepID=UPI0035B60572